MKLLCYILTCYLFLLSVIPCCAFDSCPDDKQMEAAAQQSGDDDCGNCSPFFSCEGCATATIAMDAFQHALIIQPLLSDYSVYIEQQLSEVEYDFWQPPKIG